MSETPNEAMIEITAHENYPEILADLSDHLTELCIKRGVGAEQAAVLAREIMEFLRQHWGGQKIYVPKGRLFELRERDIEIARRYNGRNRAELCREYDLTESRLLQIIHAVREREIRERQKPLF